MSRIRPILFNTDMVRAILDARKTTTRRVAKEIVPFDNDGKYWNTLRKGEWTGPVIKEVMIQQKAPYQPGDILYVRETWNETTHGYNYKASPLGNSRDTYDWRPSIHMPKAAARIWLKVIDVRVERLHNMDVYDFITEGVCITPEAFNDPENAYGQAKDAFVKIWDSTIKKADKDKYGWDANPWVWVIEFKEGEKPEEVSK